MEGGFNNHDIGNTRVDYTKNGGCILTKATDMQPNDMGGEQYILNIGMTTLPNCGLYRLLLLNNLSVYLDYIYQG